jgi:hypothetical protein
MQSKATTVAEYLASLPADRRATVSAVREVIRANLDRDYEEGMQYGMIGYYVPHRVFPAGYHCDPEQPLCFAGIASQKNYVSLHLMGIYIGCECEPGKETGEAKWFRNAWAKTGKKLDIGKACVRVKNIEDVPLEVVGEAIRRVPAKTYLERYREVLARSVRSGKPSVASAKSAKVKAGAPAKTADKKGSAKSTAKRSSKTAAVSAKSLRRR